MVQGVPAKSPHFKCPYLQNNFSYSSKSNVHLISCVERKLLNSKMFSKRVKSEVKYHGAVIDCADYRDWLNNFIMVYRVDY